VAGCCLIRLGSLRPRGLPDALGLTTENAVHRIAVEWGDEDGAWTGVFVPRRDSGSRLSVALGGRVLPESSTMPTSSRTPRDVPPVLLCWTRPSSCARRPWCGTRSRT